MTQLLPATAPQDLFEEELASQHALITDALLRAASEIPGAPKRLEEEALFASDEAQGDIKAIIRKEVCLQLAATYSALHDRIAKLERLVEAEGAKHLDDTTVIQTASQVTSKEEPPSPSVRSLSRHPDKFPPDSTYMYAPVGMEESGLEAGTLPESMFNYCLDTLTFSKKPWSEPAWLYLFLQIGMQQWLLAVFCTMNYFDFIESHITPGFDPYSHCMLERLGATKIGRILSYQLITELLCMGLIAAVVHADASASITASCPTKAAGLGVWCLSSLCWIMHVVYLPCTMAFEMALLLAQSGTPMDVLMNALAATFIIEIDEIMFASLLTTSQKEAYQNLAGRRSQSQSCKAKHPPVIGWLRLLTMVALYLGVEHVKTLSCGDCVDELTQLEPVLCFAFAAESGIVAYATSLSDKFRDKAFRTGMACVFSIVAFNLWYTMAFAGVQGTFATLGVKHHGPEFWLQCLPNRSRI